jgi:hypothetical protein
MEVAYSCLACKEVLMGVALPNLASDQCSWGWSSLAWVRPVLMGVAQPNLALTGPHGSGLAPLWHSTYCHGHGLYFNLAFVQPSWVSHSLMWLLPSPGRCGVSHVCGQAFWCDNPCCCFAGGGGAGAVAGAAQFLVKYVPMPEGIQRCCFRVAARPL